jgi:transcriptional regulator with PAS, ATPase and Fis domain
VFLDEIGELPIELQPKLLRILESGELRPVGGEKTRHVDVRVVAATNRDLDLEVAEGRFREDLYYRLAVIKVAIPPLRQRPDDVAALVDYFLKSQGADPQAVSPQVREALQTHTWPGNVRELRNFIERSVILTGSVGLPTAKAGTAIGTPSQALSALTDLNAPFKDAKDRLVETFEREYFKNLTARVGEDASISELARVSGLDRKHVRTLLERYRSSD